MRYIYIHIEREIPMCIYIYVYIYIYIYTCVVICIKAYLGTPSAGALSKKQHYKSMSVYSRNTNNI